ncbi:MAG: M17 family peptidase N-terminal domain-containing protein, partial [Rhodospirillaceae bacterium]
MKIAFANLTPPTSGAAVVFALDAAKLTASAAALDKATKGTLTRAIKASRFKGKAGQTLHALAPQNSKLGRIMVIGLGKPKDIDAKTWQRAGGYAYAGLAKTGMTAVSVMVDGIDDASVSAGDAAANLAFGAALRSYRFDKYKT